MWGIYAHNFEGICIEYDLSLLVDEFGVKIEDDPFLKGLYPVIYSKSRVNSGTSIKSMIDAKDENARYNKKKIDYYSEFSEINSLFLLKSTEWKKEKEWRFIRNIYEEKINNIESNDIYVPCVSAVYLGYRIEESKAKHIKEIIQKLNQNRNKKKIKLYESRINKYKYRIDYNEVTD